MPPLRPHMMAALPLRGKGERTHQASVREVRLRAQCYHQSPDRIAAQALPHSGLHRKNVDRLAPTSMRICYRGRRFFSPHVLQRAWHTLSLLRAPPARRLPAVLRVAEVWRLLASATPVPTQGSCTTVSRGGRRWPSIPCGIPTPPLCAPPACIPGSSSAPWGIPNSQRRWSPAPSPTKGRKRPPSAATPAGTGSCHDHPPRYLPRLCARVPCACSPPPHRAPPGHQCHPTGPKRP
jgi:hypothetical protein